MTNFSINAVFDAIDRISAPTRRIANNLRNSTRRMGRSIRQLHDSASRMAGGFESAFKRIGIAAVGATLSIVKMVDEGSKFQQAMVNASAKFNVKIDSTQYKELEKSARDLGKSTVFSAKEAADGLNFLAMAGYNYKDAIKTMPAITDLAVASSTDLAKSADILSDTLGAFNKKAGYSRKLADMMAKTTNLSNVNLEILMESVKNSGPNFKAAGGSIKDYLAILGTLGNASIKSSVAGTAVKNLSVTLMATGSAQGKLLKKLGVQVKNSKGKMRPILDILEDIKNKTKGRKELIPKIFGKEASAGMFVIFEQLKGIKKMAGEIGGSDGFSGKLSKIMGNTVQGRVKTVMSRIQDIFITFFVDYKTQITGFLDKVIAAIDTAKPYIQEFFLSFIKNFDEIWGAIKVFTPLVAGVYAVIKGVELLTAALALNPFGLMVIAIGAVALALKKYAGSWQIAGKLMEFIVDAVVDKIKFLIQMFQKAWGWATKLADKVANSGVGKIVGGAVDAVGNTVNKIATWGTGNTAEPKFKNVTDEKNGDVHVYVNNKDGGKSEVYVKHADGTITRKNSGGL